MRKRKMFLNGELFFLLDPGVLMCPSFMNDRHMAGMHGYQPNDPDSVASFASSERMSETPRGLEDMYQLMRSEADRSRGTTSAHSGDAASEKTHPLCRAGTER